MNSLTRLHQPAFVLFVDVRKDTQQVERSRIRNLACFLFSRRGKYSGCGTVLAYEDFTHLYFAPYVVRGL